MQTNSKGIVLRLLADLVVFGSAVLLPWYIFIAVALVCVFYFERYYEIILAGFIIDALFGVDRPILEGWRLAFTLFGTIVFLVAVFLKMRLKFYS